MRKLIVALLIAAVSAVAAGQSAAANRRTIKVGDDYFVRRGEVRTVTVHKGTRVTWRWRGVGLHNVAVIKGPVKFRSSYKTSGRFTRKMRRVGRYTIVCTIHRPTMRMKLRVVR